MIVIVKNEVFEQNTNCVQIYMKIVLRFETLLEHLKYLNNIIQQQKMKTFTFGVQRWIIGSKLA